MTNRLRSDTWAKSGIRGRVTHIDLAGNAYINFVGIGEDRVFKSELHNLKKVEAPGIGD